MITDAVCIWLNNLLCSRYPKQRIVVNPSKAYLSSWLIDNKLMHYFPDGVTYNIKASIYGVACSRQAASLYLIKIQKNYISIKTLSDFIIYPLIVKPYRAIIISPGGANPTLSKLITVYNRIDVLNYKEKISRDSIIRICKWDVKRNTVDYNSTLPYGYHP